MRRLITYRGDLATARLNYKKAKKKSLRKFKRKLLEAWDIRNGATLWDRWVGYHNDDLREVLGIKENFLTSTKNLSWFGVELKPTVKIDAVLNLAEDQKDYIRDKALDVFQTYGKTIKVAYDDVNSYDYKIFKDGIETSFDGENDEELATLLYSRLVMYMIDNDSTDTQDRWSDVNPNDFDYWTSYTKTKTINIGSDENPEYRTVSEDARSNLKYFTYTFTNSDILKVVNDRLFTKRRYKVSGSEEDNTTYSVGIDTALFHELLDDGNSDLIDTRYWGWNGTKYEINYEAVKALPPDEFLIFIQTHLHTFHKVKKKWYQSGLFGFLMIVVTVVVAVLTQQYWLIGVSLGTTLVIAGMVLSISGALLGNEVMIMGGQIVALVGGAVSLAETIALEQAAIETYTQQMAAAGVESQVMTQAVNVLKDELLLNTMLSVGKFGLNTFSTFSNMTGSDEVIEKATTPREKLNEIFIADDMYWDGINSMFPEYQIASMMKVM